MGETEMTSFRLPADLREQSEASGDSLSDTLRYAVLLFLGICPTCDQKAPAKERSEEEERRG
jgi:hypothetical protein